MSKIIFEPRTHPMRGEYVRITTIWRGSKAGKYNSDVMSATNEYARQVRKFLKRPSLKSLGVLMNYPNNIKWDDYNRESSFREEIHQAYFFVMRLLWALNEKLEIKEVPA